MWNFQMRAVKIDRFLLQNQYTQEILLLWKQKNWQAVNNCAHFYWIKWLKLKMLYTEVLQLIWYWGKYINFKKIKLILDLKIYSKNWKWLNFAGSPFFLFIKYQNLLWVCGFLCKKLLIFTSLIWKLKN